LRYRAPPRHILCVLEPSRRRHESNWSVWGPFRRVVAARCRRGRAVRATEGVPAVTWRSGHLAERRGGHDGPDSGDCSFMVICIDAAPAAVMLGPRAHRLPAFGDGARGGARRVAVVGGRRCPAAPLRAGDLFWAAGNGGRHLVRSRTAWRGPWWSIMGSNSPLPGIRAEKSV